VNEADAQILYLYRIQALEGALNQIRARRVKFKDRYQAILDEWPAAFRSRDALAEMESMWRFVHQLFMIADNGMRSAPLGEPSESEAASFTRRKSF